jgi:hypothetical protein
MAKRTTTPRPPGTRNRRPGTCHDAHGQGVRHGQLTKMPGSARRFEVTYCFFFDFAASKRPRLVAKRSSTKPAANIRIRINRIVSTPTRTPPDIVLIVTSEQENCPAMWSGKNIRQVSQKSHSETFREERRGRLCIVLPHLRTLHHGSSCVLDRLSALLSEGIGSALKGGVKVCQRQLVNEVLVRFITEFAHNLGREAATPIQRGFNARLLGRV